MTKLTLIIAIISITLFSGCLKYTKKRIYFTNKSENKKTHGVRVYRYLGFSK